MTGYSNGKKKKKKIEEFGPTLQHVKQHFDLDANALNRLHIQKERHGIDVMLNHPPMDPRNPLLNRYPIDL